MRRLFLFNAIYFLGLFSCESKKTDQSDCILQIENIEITRYEFEKKLDRFIGHSQKSTQQIDNWIDKFIDNTLFLADAFEKGYYNDPDIEKRVDIVAEQMLTEYHGYLYNELVLKNINITQQDLQDAYDKSAIQQTLAYIKFKDRQQFNKVMGSDTLINNDKFYDIADCKNNVSFEFVPEIELYWPNSQWWEIRKDIFKLKKGEVSKPIYRDENIYIFYVKDIKTIPQKPYAKVENNLEKFLNRINEIRLMKKFTDDIYHSSQLTINEKLCKDIYNLFEQQPEKHVFNIILFEPFLNKNVLSFKLGDDIVNTTLMSFVNYYHNRLIRKAIDSYEKFEFYLREYVFHHVALKMARDLGLDKNKLYKLDYNSHKNKVVLKEYLLKEFQNSEISDTELKTYYNDNQDKYQEGTSAIFSFFLFNSRRNAQNGMEIIRHNIKQALNTTLPDSLFEGLVLAEFNDSLHYSKNHRYIENDIIFRLEKGKVSLPVPAKNNQYAVVLKVNQNGNRTLDFAQVKNEIREHLLNFKIDSLKNIRVSELREKYCIQNNIIPAHYYNIN